MSTQIVKVRLNEARGKYAAGSVVEVDEIRARYLVENGLAEEWSEASAAVEAEARLEDDGAPAVEPRPRSGRKGRG